MLVTGYGYKLPPFVIIKGEEGKNIEKIYRNFPFVQIGEMYLFTLICKPSYWLQEVYLPYQKFNFENCLLILDNTISHNSKESIKLLKEYNFNYSFIPAGMNQEC